MTPRTFRSRQVRRRRERGAVILAALALGLAACSQNGGVDELSPAPSASSSATPTEEATHAVGPAPPPLVVSANGRFLETPNGEPFVYQADTAWALINRTTPEDVVRYLDARQEQGFNVIQTVAIFPIAGVEPNYAGHLPFDGNVGTPNPAYFEHADFVISEIQRRGMYVALIPIWMFGAVDYGHISAESARTYGEWLGHRYADDRSIIWVTGGDSRQFDTEVDNALATGITVGVAGSEDYTQTLMTYHPGAPQTSGPAYHDAPWLDFNMVHSSHCGLNQDFVRENVAREPAKPTLDAESMYEDHPLCWDEARGYSTPAQVRAGMYGSVFAGGMGFVYGNQSTWQLYQPDREPIFSPIGYWFDMLDRPAAWQGAHLRGLIESRPMASRVADQALIASDPGGGEHFVAAVRGEDRSWAMVYTTSRPFTLDLPALSPKQVTLTWFDPRTGESTTVEPSDTTAAREFTPPGEEDWVLIVDDVNAGFAAPTTAPPVTPP